MPGLDRRGPNGLGPMTGGMRGYCNASAAAYRSSFSEGPGRSLAPNTGMAIKLSEIKPDAIYISSCMANAKPACPYASAEEMAKIIQDKTGVPVVLGTHDYH